MISSTSIVTLEAVGAVTILILDPLTVEKINSRYIFSFFVRDSTITSSLSFYWFFTLVLFTIDIFVIPFTI